MSSRPANNEAAEASGEFIGYSFGGARNQILSLRRRGDADRRRAEDSLQEAFAGADIAGRTFLDLGSGSGIYSDAAFWLGARSVTSIDIDLSSIACASYLRDRAGKPASWSVIKGSALDADLMRTIEPVDRLYSWGVLHHTGAMWEAFDAAVRLIAPGGMACIALSNRPRHPGLHLALRTTYRRLPRFLRPPMRWGYGATHLLKVTLTGRNPAWFVRDYSLTSRGLSFWRDVEDSLGGLPYEYAEPGEVHDRVEGLGLRIVRSVVGPPGANNEYLIARLS